MAAAFVPVAQREREELDLIRVDSWHECAERPDFGRSLPAPRQEDVGDVAGVDAAKSLHCNENTTPGRQPGRFEEKVKMPQFCNNQSN
jgi:hypothetical protein